MAAWNLVKLDDVCEIQRGGSPRPIENFITNSQDGINWIKIGDVAVGAKYITKTGQKIRPEGAQRSRVVGEGDFLLSNSMSFGRPYILKTSGCIHDGWLVLRYNKNLLTEDYLYHVLSSNFVYAQFVKLAVGAVVKNLNCEVVKQVVIPLPPIPEQRRIAAILDEADALRAKHRESLTQLDSLTQAIFMEMFGDPRENEHRWPVAAIGSFISGMRGGAALQPDDFTDNGFPILHKGAIKPQGRIEVDEKKKTFASHEYAASKPNCIADRTHIAVTLRDLVPSGPSIGLAADLRYGQYDRYLLAQGAYAFLLDVKKVTAEYFVQLSNMPTFRYVLRQNAVGSTQIHIRTPIYLAITLPIPPIELQNKFAEKIKAIVVLKRKFKASLTEIETLVASLQYRAFRGEL